MKEKFLPAVLSGILVWGHAASAATAPLAPPPLLPVPQHARYDGHVLDLAGGVRILLGPSAPHEVMAIADLLNDNLRAGPEAAFPPIPLTLAIAPATSNPEGYWLRIGPSSIDLSAPTPRGLLWGAQTLLQSIDRSAGKPALATADIADWPARPWRALMLDPARSFLGLDFLRRTIRAMSAYKLNVLHLHLTDDQSWRFESKAFPRVNRPGEPYYSQAELRKLAIFADRLGVDVVPEFDFPGHAMTAVNAYPELDCEGQPRAVGDAILCPCHPFTWTFLEGVVAEAAAVFPSRYLDLGADEPFALQRWSVCPEAARASSLASQYNGFVCRLDDLAKRHGKTLIVWNDAIHPDAEPAVPKDVIVDGWKDYGNISRLAAAGYGIINSSSVPLYLTSLGYRDGAPLETVMGWNATWFAGSDSVQALRAPDYRRLPARAHILGGQACAWATEQTLLESRLYPRLLAVAGALWSERSPKELPEMGPRLRAAEERLRAMGVTFQAALPATAVFAGTDQQGWRRTRQSYRNFVLTFDVRSLPSAEAAAVVIRCGPARSVSGRPLGYGIAVAPATPYVTSPKLKPLTGWHHFEVVAQERVVSLTIDGVLIWSTADPVPQAGPLAVNTGEGAARFRNFRIRDLARDPRN